MIFKCVSIESKALCAQMMTEQMSEICRRKWFEDGETLTLEIDTEAETCRVVPL